MSTNKHSKSQKICNKCGYQTYKLYPHPQDSEQETMVCEDCEYEITAHFQGNQPKDPDEPTDYGSITHGK